MTTTGYESPETSTDSHKQPTTTHNDPATTEYGARDTSTTVDTWEPTFQSTSESEVSLTTDGSITTTVDLYSFVTDAEDERANIEASSSEESTDEPGNRAASRENQQCGFEQVRHKTGMYSYRRQLET